MAITAQVAGAYGGRGKRRGNRVSLVVKVPEDLKRAVEAAAAESGLAITDYVTLVLGRRFNMPDPDYIDLPSAVPVDQLDLGLPDRRESRLSA